MSLFSQKDLIEAIKLSGAEEFIEKYKDKDDSSQFIGHFGLGFYSAFMVSKYVEIKSKSYINKSKSAYWKCDGNTEFEIKPSDKKERGTDIILHINDDSKDFLEESKIEEILKKSRKLTQGYKMEIFILHLRFIPWYLVGILCFFIGIFFIIPWHQLTLVNYYNYLLSLIHI